MDTAATASAGRPLLEMRGVSKSFPLPGHDHERTEILRAVDLTLGPGDACAIVGPSGSGKSTLLHLAAVLDLPDAGTVRIDGTDVGSLDEAARTALRHDRIGLVFQEHHLLPQCTAIENVLVPTIVRTSKAERRRAVDRGRDLLTRVGLGARMDHRPGQLSGGECQRVAVVRALILEPCLLLADEPTGSLDAANTSELADLFLQLREERDVGLLLVTHSAALAERMETVVELRAGELRLAGAPA
jgi:lipoprotein-releasing system ATP-binding protein